MSSIHDELENGKFFYPQEIKELDLPTPPVYITQSNVPCLWERGITGNKVKVAVIDTGCDVTNPLLHGKIARCYNFTTDDTDDNVTDYIGHGTHIATIIAGESYCHKVMGIAPDVSLHIYKVVEKDGIVPYGRIAQAIYASAQNGADIINVSLGGSKPSDAMFEAIEFARKLNKVVICASGNDGDGNAETTELLYPSCYPNVISVSAMNWDYSISKFSSSNDFINFTAFGEHVVSSGLESGFYVLSGTSQATPVVTGCSALVFQWFVDTYNRKPTIKEMYDILLENTNKIPNVDKKQQGNGYICFNKEYFEKDTK